MIFFIFAPHANPASPASPDASGSLWEPLAGSLEEPLAASGSAQDRGDQPARHAAPGWYIQPRELSLSRTMPINNANNEHPTGSKGPEADVGEGI